MTAPDEERLEKSQHLIDEANKIADDLREKAPDTAPDNTPEPPGEA